MPKSRSVLEVATRYLDVREEPKGSNRAPEIDRWLKDVGSPLGSAWCAAFMYGIHKESETPFPFVRSGRVQTIVDSGTLLPASTAVPGDLVVFWFPKLGRYAHIALCVKVGKKTITTIDGNTIPDGAAGDQREGYGVFQKVRPISDRIKLLRPRAPGQNLRGTDARRFADPTFSAREDRAA